MALPEEFKEGFISQLRLLLVALKKPKLSYEELISLPLKEFGVMFGKFVIKYKKEQTPEVPGTTTYIFPPKEMPLSEIKPDI
ncbi:hypothetical protein LCGC14_1213750 [marine sediment metagenome]|uniref:Uncharacterized protein n=1 Tax=marine sediment metagenome TaxID=412755 RepID=A0A0F9PHY2_9ZZZZ